MKARSRFPPPTDRSPGSLRSIADRMSHTDFDAVLHVRCNEARVCDGPGTNARRTITDSGFEPLAASMSSTRVTKRGVG